MPRSAYVNFALNVTGDKSDMSQIYQVAGLKLGEC